MSKSHETDVEFIHSLAKLLRETDLSELEVSRDGDSNELTVRMARTMTAPPVQIAAAPAPVAAPVAAAPAPAAAPAAEAADPSGDPNAVTSPMVGTVYLSPEPGAGNFVSIGDQVEEGQTILIIEAMKTMNQIPSPKAGVVKRIVAANEQPVEYGAPLMIIE